ncbi:chorismate mutase [Jannaschia faecimaris]|uniref:chorismate mutase n=1 Tax=Jannaschia faecimaris TaxID=1244108 RepID=A0A1H3L9V8_9RHOB|nr:chorismate mutase [Jannaschia faecimaris]SDY60675.1 chorismate mutase [Jannaschia faecimaris]
MTSPRPDPATLKTLADCRAGIDAIDGELMILLAERQAHVAQVVGIKAREGVAAAAPTRAAAVIERTRQLALDVGVDADLAEALWQTMIDHFITKEEAVLGKGGSDL